MIYIFVKDIEKINQLNGGKNLDKIIILHIIFVVALLTMGMALSTNELISKNQAPDYVAHTNHDSQPVTRMTVTK